ncbi:hypothetical protein [Clostridium sp.]|uniref:hypothetical protein n=1 Tax=Clostridium sp. TaxID=1506 RepID=UPI001DFD04AC|nr:hypothetical protein [Clostridium sp.]MBS5939000.1 hypothetical protein [Clostridium sp.]
MVKIFDESNLDEYRENHKDKFVYEYAYPFLSYGSENLISNLKTNVKVLQLSNGREVIITINKKEYSNTYTVSHFSHFITYCYDELYCLNNKILEFVLRPIIYLIGLLFKTGEINNIAIVNSLMLSTNLINNLSFKELKEIKEYLIKNYLKSTIVFRSLNNYFYSNISASLEKLDFKKLPSRQIYLLKKSDTLNKSARKKINQDYKLISKNNLDIIDIKETIYSAEIVKLYNMLYIDKYSKSNPMINKTFVEFLINNDKFIFKGLINKDMELMGVIGCFVVNNTLTTPILGYDTSKEIDLYRMLTSMINKLGEELSCNIHRSSGVGKFKKLRGSKKDIEYIYYYNEHLAFYRKMPYKLLSILNSKRIIKFIMERDF